MEEFRDLLSSSDYDFRFVLVLCIQLCSLNIRYDCGVSKAVHSIAESEKDDIISSLCLHFVILTSKAELDGLVNGLKSLEVLSLIQSNPNTSRKLFVRSTDNNVLTADLLYDMFSAELSPLMSNTRDKKEAQLFNWSNFLHFVEGMTFY